MTRAWLLLLLLAPAALCAQEASVEAGAKLYRMHCAVPYCHGPDGTAGRAPQLTGHTQSLNSIFKVISWGIPGTGMPEFTTRLKTEEIADLVAYVTTMRGPGPATAAAAAPPRTPPAEAREGRALFFDAARTGGCGTCHELDGWGAPVGPDLAALAPGKFADLRRATQSRVRTARPAGGEPFPALVVEHTETRVRVYDLTARLPVLRTFGPAQIALGPNSAWRHEEVMRIYTDRELEIIARYLRWRAGP